jgi:hypothetical protein
VDPIQASTDDEVVYEHAPLRPLRELALADAIGFASLVVVGTALCSVLAGLVRLLEVDDYGGSLPVTFWTRVSIVQGSVSVPYATVCALGIAAAIAAGAQSRVTRLALSGAVAFGAFYMVLNVLTALGIWVENEEPGFGDATATKIAVTALAVGLAFVGAAIATVAGRALADPPAQVAVPPAAG